jgi:hypothetical protein
MTNKIKKIKKEINAINQNLLDFLYKQIKDKGSFPLKSYYGETHTAAAFSIANKYSDLIPLIINSYLDKDKRGIDVSWEFNHSALQHIKKQHYKEISSALYPLYFNMPFYRKVTNWMLLRALIYFRSIKKFDHLKANLIVWLVLLLQQRKGILFDNRIYRKKEKSHQYHAFATSLLGEIYLLTKNKFYLERFNQAFIYLKKITKNPKSFNIVGRGSKQIFGYVSAIHSLILGGFIFKDSGALDHALALANHLKKFQRKNGSFPLVLAKSEFNLSISKYKDNLKLKNWESYNTYYDYLGFTALYLEKTKKFIQDNK